MGNIALPHRGTGASENSRIGPPPVKALPLWGIELFPIEVRVLGSLRNFRLFSRTSLKQPPTFYTRGITHTPKLPHHTVAGVSLVIFSFGGTHD